MVTNNINLEFFILDKNLFITRPKISYRNLGGNVREWKNHQAAQFHVSYNLSDQTYNLTVKDHHKNYPKERDYFFYSSIKEVLQHGNLDYFTNIYLLLRNPKERIYSGIIECIKHSKKEDFNSQDVKKVIESPSGDLKIDYHYDAGFYYYRSFIEKFKDKSSYSKIKYIDLDKHANFNIPLFRKFGNHETGNPIDYSNRNLHNKLEKLLKTQNTKVISQLEEHIKSETKYYTEIKKNIEEFVIQETIHIL